MKVTLKIDPLTPEERVDILARERNAKVDAIVKACNDCGEKVPLCGFIGEEMVILKENTIDFVFTEDGKIYVSVKGKRLLVKKRLYEIEKMLVSSSFVKINQSCIVNLDKVIKFDLSFSGTIGCVFQSGERQYVSRRCLAAVKKKLGL